MALRELTDVRRLGVHTSSLRSGLINRSRFKPGELQDTMKGREITITVPAKCDWWGTVELPLFHQGLWNERHDSPGLPITSLFTIDAYFQYKIRAGQRPDKFTFLNSYRGDQSKTDWSGRMPLQRLKGGNFSIYGHAEAGNPTAWKMVSIAGLEGLEFEAVGANPFLNGGGFESGNAFVGALEIARQIFTAGIVDLGLVFTNAEVHENISGDALSGGQGLAAAIGGGANAYIWTGARGPWTGIVAPLFRENQYADFAKHVFLGHAGKDAKAQRDSEDTNGKWTQAFLGLRGGQAGFEIHDLFTRASIETAAAFANPGGIDWPRACNSFWIQSDIRQKCAPSWSQGMEDLLAKGFVVKDNKGRILRGYSRPGAGGLTTGIIGFAVTEELAQEGKTMLGEPLNFTHEIVEQMNATGWIPKGQIVAPLRNWRISIDGITGLAKVRDLQKVTDPDDLLKVNEMLHGTSQLDELIARKNTLDGQWNPGN